MKRIRQLALILLVALAGCSVTTPETARLIPSDAQKNDTFASSVAISGDQAVVGVPRDDHGGVNAGAVYVFQRTPMGWQQQVKLEAAAGVDRDQFGSAVAMDGDTIVVGAPGVSRPSEVAGAVYVFRGSGSNWSQQARLQASDAAQGDSFGFAVAVNGQRIVVGAPTKGQFVGAAYVFERIGATWAQQAKLTADDATDHDVFGASVAVFGVTAIIGAPGDDAGSAYVFQRFVGVWVQTKLNTSGAPQRRDFGRAVSIDADTAVVGASRDDSAAPVAGAGYVFHRNAVTGTWSPQARLLANDANREDRLGFTVALSGDTVVLGRESPPFGLGHGPGSAYIFNRSGATWSQQAKLPTPSGAVRDEFGFAVAASRGTVLIGAPTDDEFGPLAGAAYTFTRPSNSWTLESRLTASGPAVEDEFGIAVSVSGDRAVVGADRSDFDLLPDNMNTIDVGAAYVYVRQGSTWTAEAKLFSSDVIGHRGDLFGQSVAIDGDTIVAGAPDNDSVAPNAGAVYVDVRSGSSWMEQARLTASDGAAGDLFGNSVAISGNTLVVGALGDDDLGGESGSAYVFVRSGGTWTQQAKLTASDGTSGDGFALSVAINGDRVVTGAPTNGPGATGAAYVFQRNGTTWTQAPKLIANDGTSGHFFGWSVDVSADRVVAGAPGDNHAGPNAGSVYVFGPAGNGWAQRCKLTAPGAKANQSLGWSVATDGSTVAVGSVGDDVRGARSGSVFDFGLGVIANLCPQRQHHLVGTDTAAGHTLGWSVAVSGGTIVAGATGAGAAYVFPAA